VTIEHSGWLPEKHIPSSKPVARSLDKNLANIGWRKKKLPNFCMALCNRLIKLNPQKSTCLMSKHLRISIFA